MNDNGKPLAIVPPENALAVAELFQAPGELCIRLTTDEDGNRHTDFTFRGMNHLEVMALAREIAMCCRLARIAGWKPPAEEHDTLGLDHESKVCCTYRAGRQSMNWLRKNISYLDAELACDIVAAICERIVIPEGSYR